LFSRYKKPGKANTAGGKPKLHAVPETGAAPAAKPASTPGAAPAAKAAPKTPTASNSGRRAPQQPTRAEPADREKKRRQRLGEIKQELHKQLLDNLNLAALDTASEKDLRAEKGIITANTFQCRGFGPRLRKRYRLKRQDAGYSVRVVSIVVQKEAVDDLFEYIYYKVNFDHPCPGLIYQGDLLAATQYTLPAGVVDEGGE